MTLSGRDLPGPASAGFFYLNDTELAEVWQHARKNNLALGRSELGNRIATSMRARCPVPGWEWDKLLTVWLQPGGRRELIQPHAHKRHAVLFYPLGAAVIVEKQERTLLPGEIIYLKPHTTHEVPRVTVERLSVAMLVSEPADR